MRKRAMGALANNNGQSTVEFAVIAAAFLALVIGLGSLWRAFDEGMFVNHAVSSASHHLEGIFPGGGFGDVVLF